MDGSPPPVTIGFHCSEINADARRGFPTALDVTDTDAKQVVLTHIRERLGYFETTVYNGRMSDLQCANRFEAFRLQRTTNIISMGARHSIAAALSHMLA